MRISEREVLERLEDAKRSNKGIIEYYESLSEQLVEEMLRSLERSGIVKETEDGWQTTEVGEKTLEMLDRFE